MCEHSEELGDHLEFWQRSQWVLCQFFRLGCCGAAKLHGSRLAPIVIHLLPQARTGLPQALDSELGQLHAQRPPRKPVLPLSSNSAESQVLFMVNEFLSKGFASVDSIVSVVTFHCDSHSSTFSFKGILG